MTTTDPAGTDPVELFRKLDAELRAAATLIRLSTSTTEQRRAALDGLQLARDVLADALDALDVVDDERTRQADELARPVADVALPVADFTTARTSCACGEHDLGTAGEIVGDFTPDGRTMRHESSVCVLDAEAEL